MVPVTNTAWGSQNTKEHSRSFCSQNLTLPHPEPTAGVTCCHPSPLGTEHARTDRLSVQCL